MGMENAPRQLPEPEKEDYWARVERLAREAENKEEELSHVPTSPVEPEATPAPPPDENQETTRDKVTQAREEFQRKNQDTRRELEQRKRTLQEEADRLIALRQKRPLTPEEMKRYKELM